MLMMIIKIEITTWLLYFFLKEIIVGYVVAKTLVKTLSSGKSTIQRPEKEEKDTARHALVHRTYIRNVMRSNVFHIYY